MDLASVAIDAACRAVGIVLGQAHVFGLKGYGSILQDKAGNADIANGLGVIESRIGVAQASESRHIAHVFAYINELETRVALYLFLYIIAVRAGFETINLNHSTYIYGF